MFQKPNPFPKSIYDDVARANRDLPNIMVAKNLERIADHCTNVAEDVI